MTYDLYGQQQSQYPPQQPPPQPPAGRPVSRAHVVLGVLTVLVAVGAATGWLVIGIIAGGVGICVGC